MSESVRIVSIEWTPLKGRRPRHAGSNARQGDHGWSVTFPVCRITCSDGSQGWGYGNPTRDEARSLLGKGLDELFDPKIGATQSGMMIDFPLWDLSGRRAGVPVYQLVADFAGTTLVHKDGLSVPCYDTSLYFDDLHLETHHEAVELVVAQANEGRERGHTNFKIKVGRGAFHMPLQRGTERDIQIVNGLRSALGSEATLMIDANNGYNFNLTHRILQECASSDLYWVEEPFHEDPVLYAELRRRLDKTGNRVRIADGEGIAAPPLITWAEAGLIQVIQYDIFSYGFTPWLTLGQRLDRCQVQSAPHHYGRHLGNYYSGHLFAAIQNFAFVEWDEVSTPEIGAPDYHIEAGHVHIPNRPGFGLELDEERFRHSLANEGWVLHEDNSE